MAIGVPKGLVRAVQVGVAAPLMSAQLATGSALAPQIPAAPTNTQPQLEQVVGDQFLAQRLPPVVSDPNRGGVTPAGLNPAVSPAMQRATFERIFQLGRQLTSEGKVPVIVIDHRHTALDDRPIIRAGFEALVRRNNITELANLDTALNAGTLKFLPGYTEQASDHWRQAHPALVSKYPNAFGSSGQRMPIDFMGAPLSQARATDGLANLLARWKAETQGRGEVIFAGAGTGRIEDLRAIYSRPVSQGGAGINTPDVRFGSPSVSAAADARANQMVAQYNAANPGAPVVLDNDSRGKAGWVETIERESAGGRPKVVAAFIDDRAHNRFAAQAASQLGTRQIAVKAVAPGISFSQLDNSNQNQISTFTPAP
jgi:hypothetical protein